MFAASGGAVSDDRTYIEDVFSTYLYTGNGSTQTINNGIDLAGKGGLVWIKNRVTAGEYHALTDTARGNLKLLYSNVTDAEATSASCLTGFSASGFSLGTNTLVNGNTLNFASWTFRKAPKFFDVVTYTGNFVNGRQISHSLGQAPGMIIVKRTNGNSNWMVYHRSLGATKYSILQSSGASGTDSAYWNDTEPTANSFTVGLDAAVNGNGSTYVAYLFAHDTTTDGLIQCGSFTTDSSGNATVNLGWEPQYLLYKTSSTTGGWRVVDTMRSWPATGVNTAYVEANTSLAEETMGSTTYPAAITNTGFSFAGAVTSATHIYMAIRRGPMRTPTDATKVFAVDRVTPSTGNSFTTNFPVDLSIANAASNGIIGYFQDRLRGYPTTSSTVGNYPVMFSTSTGAESAYYGSSPYIWGADSNTAVKYGSNLGGLLNTTYAFRRAPGFFDEVCWTGNGLGSPTTINHNLGVVPEFLLYKGRNSTHIWRVYHKDAPSADLALNSDYIGGGINFYEGTWSATQFKTAQYEGYSPSVNYVAYLFASCPGVSKVGSYTGNGSSQVINCGFSGGARFVLIWRKNSTGNWYVWDTARGIVANNDPHISLNATAAEVTTDDTIDPDSTGFIVNQVAATDVNVNAATYIYLAIA